MINKKLASIFAIVAVVVVASSIYALDEIKPIIYRSGTA